MAIGVLNMYIDNTIIEDMRTRFGLRTGTSIGVFLEEWRNYGQDWIMEKYPERTVYYFVDILIKERIMEKESKGRYKLVAGYENPVKP